MAITPFVFGDIFVVFGHLIFQMRQSPIQLFQFRNNSLFHLYSMDLGPGDNIDDPVPKPQKNWGRLAGEL